MIINPDMYFLPWAEKLWSYLVEIVIDQRFSKNAKNMSKENIGWFLIQSSVFGNFLAPINNFWKFHKIVRKFLLGDYSSILSFLFLASNCYVKK